MIKAILTAPLYYVLGVFSILWFIFITIPIFILLLPFFIGVKIDLSIRDFWIRFVSNVFPYSSFRYMMLSEDEKFKQSEEAEQDKSEEK